MDNWKKFNIAVDDWDNLISLKILENRISNGNYVDVGACIGIYTDFFKKNSGENGMVYSFEMNPNNYRSLIHFNDKNCIVENLAISDKSDLVEIYTNSSNPGDHVSNIIGHNTNFERMESIGKVRSISLDEYFENKKVDFIKIDVEGAELKVIKGGIKTIQKSKMTIIECHFDEDWKEICEELDKSGCQFKYLIDDSPIFYGSTNKIPGRSEIGRGYQIYCLNY